jgi:hypothetical protein
VRVGLAPERQCVVGGFSDFVGQAQRAADDEYDRALAVYCERRDFVR